MATSVRLVKTCSTCRHERGFLLKHGVKFEEDRELNSAPLTVAGLEALMGARDYNPPARSQALKLMAEQPNLIRRPVLVVGNRILLGLDEKAWKETLS